MSREIYANHAHIFPASVREDGTGAVLKGIMAQHHIAGCVCFAPFYEFMQGTGKDANAWLRDEIRGDASLTGFGVIDFQAGDIPGQVSRIAEYGFPGIKLHPAFQKVRIDGPACCQVYERAQELGLFISFHTGIHWHRIADYSMLLFDEIAYRFPRLKFSMEHVGGYCFFKEAVAVMLNNQRNPNGLCVYAGLTSVFDRDMNRPWFLSDGQIRDLLWLTGEDNCIFGLDFPYNDSRKIGEAIAHIEALDIPESAKAAILGGNLRRLLQL